MYKKLPLNDGAPTGDSSKRKIKNDMNYGGKKI